MRSNAGIFYPKPEQGQYTTESWQVYLINPENFGKIIDCVEYESIAFLSFRKRTNKSIVITDYLDSGESMGWRSPKGLELRDFAFWHIGQLLTYSETFFLSVSQ